MAISNLLDIRHDTQGRPYIETWVRGIALLRFVLVNKGTAFTLEERRQLGLDGLLPSRVSTMEEQIERCYQQFLRRETMLEKYVFLRELQENQEVLCYALIERHLEEMLPVIYTPTVGEAVEQFSEIFQNPRGLTVNPDNVERIDDVIDNYPLNDVRMIVATDSSAILGIGDQGYGGLAISIGKLSLYTVGGGISPFHSMPVGLDVGTDNESLRAHPLYLGADQPRLKDEAYLEFIDRFVQSVKTRWPDAIVQWEDLAKDAAFTVLERYRDELPSFNDDIQGTGGVALAGVIAACARKGTRLRDEVVLVYGAGAGGIGVAEAIRDGMMLEGLTREEATARILVLDSRGLLIEGRRSLDRYKASFAQTRDRIAGWSFEGDAPNLVETVEQGGVTCLIGLSGQPRSFTRELVERVAENTDRPIIFPLSNPTKLTEILPVDAIAWTKGRAIVATGSPFEPVEYGSTTHVIGQGNNAFIFPGLGLGAMLCRASRITDRMVIAAAQALADYTLERYAGTTLIYPPLRDLQIVSKRVAQRVIEAAVAEGANRDPMPSGDELTALIEARFWKSEYLPVRYVPGGNTDGADAAP